MFRSPSIEKNLGPLKIGVSLESPNPDYTEPVVPFDANDYPYLQYWFKPHEQAVDDGYTDGALMSLLRNYKTGGSNATQGNNTHKPTYNEATQNGLDSARFDGASVFDGPEGDYVMMNSGITFTHGCTIFMVVNSNGSRGNGGYLCVSDSAGFDYQTGDAMVVGTAWGGSTATPGPGHNFTWRGTMASEDNIDNSSPMILMDQISGSAAGTVTKTCKRNNVTFKVDSTSAASGSIADQASIGNRLQGASVLGPWAKLDLFEYIIYGYAMSSAEIDTVHAYLNNKWSIY